VSNLIKQAKEARKVSYRIASLSLEERNNVLNAVAEALTDNTDRIMAANEIDLAEGRLNNISNSLYKRLELSEKKIHDIAEGVRSVASLADPLGRVSLNRELDKGLELLRESVPIGVIGVIFESRPDAFVQIASLCIKSGNAAILKGGSEALNTNRELYKIISEAAVAAHNDFEGAVILAETREDISSILGLDEYIDLMIPRGSNALVKYIKENTKIPVLGHADGICHMYVDKSCSIDEAIKISRDAKVQYPAVCNAIETLLVHKDCAAEFLPLFSAAVPEVELRGDSAVCEIINCKEASEEDWDTEYNDYILSVKIVDNVESAVEHINAHGSHHSDGIVSEDKRSIEIFKKNVDSSSVMINCSTRFADGFRYGFGAEVGISTGKIHARGPVGLEGLTTTRYVLSGNGHIVAPYADGSALFTHKDK
jgi:glutamate-5-semialdehyde dehydrogenase